MNKNAINLSFLGGSYYRRSMAGAETTTYSLQDGTKYSSLKELYTVMRSQFSGMQEFKYSIVTFRMNSDNLLDDLTTSAEAVWGK